MAAQYNESQTDILTKILWWLVQANNGGVVGNQGQLSVLDAAAAASNQVVKASAGQLYALTAYNGSGATRYLHVFNAASLPADGTVPTLAPVQIPDGATGSIDFGALGRPFSTGIVAAFSSTADTLTAASGGIFDAVYR